MGDDGETQVITQPGPSIPAYSQSPEMAEYLRWQSQLMGISMPALESYIRDVFPLERARAIQREQFISPILRGENLSGAYSMLGQGFGEGEEATMFERSQKRLEEQMNKMGALDSGATAELTRRGSQDIALASAEKSRAEKAQLLNLAMGLPMSALPTAQTAAESAGGAISDYDRFVNQYAMSQAQASAPRVVGTQYQPGWGEMFGDILGPAAGTMGGAFAYKIIAPIACFPEGTLIMINSHESLPIEELVKDDKILGGRIIKIQKLYAPKFKFVKVITDKGKLICSIDHPIFDKVIDIKRIKNRYRFAYDILTDSGHYYVNRIKVGSAMQIIRSKKKKEVTYANAR